MSYRILKNRILQHTLFWVVFIALFTVLLGSSLGYRESFFNVLKETIIYAIACYINLLYLIPRFLHNGQYRLYFSGVFVLLILIVPVHSWVEYQNYYRDDTLNGNINAYKLALLSTTNIIFMLAVTTGLKFGKSWFNQQNEKRKLEREKLQAELRYLKAQINPHFLFNTLNNLYALTLKKADTAPDVVLKLSEIMRYMLYESNEKLVPLKKEITYLENYIELESIRKQNSNYFDFKVKGNAADKSIAPLLLIPFLENAIKHGRQMKEDQPAVFIEMNIFEDLIEFSVINHFSEQKNKKTGGFGLENVKKRLNFIYPNQHQLKIEQTDSTFKVNLHIQFSNNEYLQE